MSRGVPRSSSSSGRSGESRAARTWSAVSTGTGLPVAATTMSEAASEAGMQAQSTPRPPNSAAVASARSRVRLATVSCRTPSAFRYCSVSRAISPAPRTSTRLSAKRSKMSFANSPTATLATLSRPSPIRVSARTREATRSARWNSECVTGPLASPRVDRSYAFLTCCTIWDSPTTMLSMPAATSNRCRTASGPSARSSSSAKSGAGRSWNSLRKETRSAWFGGGSSPGRATYSSTRLQVLTTTCSQPGWRRESSAWARRTSSSLANESRSRTSSFASR